MFDFGFTANQKFNIKNPKSTSTYSPKARSNSPRTRPSSEGSRLFGAATAGPTITRQIAPG